MDLYGEIYAMNHTPEANRGRQLRRARRKAEIHDQIANALNYTALERTAVSWNLRPHRHEDAIPIGNQHPGHVAVMAVDQALSEFVFPQPPELRFAGMKRVSGQGQHGLEEGVLVVEAVLKSLSGPEHVVDIPVQVHEGRAIFPQVLLENGVVRVLTQNTFDDIIKRGEFMIRLPDRSNMFGRPPDRSHPMPEVPLLRPGMFGLAPVNRALVARRQAQRNAIAGAVRGFEVAGQENQATRQLSRALSAMNMGRWDIALDALSNPGGDLAGVPRRIIEGLRMEVRGEARGIEGRLGMPPAVTQAVQNVVTAWEQSNPGDGGFDRGELADNPFGPPPQTYQAFYTHDLYPDIGITGADVPGADGSHVDPAECEVPDLRPGDTVRTTYAMTIRDRGGVAYEVPSGSRGGIIRDMDGTGRAFYVDLEDFGPAYLCSDGLKKRGSHVFGPTAAAEPPPEWLPVPECHAWWLDWARSYGGSR
jgi:hypothetical protein